MLCNLRKWYQILRLGVSYCTFYTTIKAITLNYKFFNLVLRWKFNIHFYRTIRTFGFTAKYFSISFHLIGNNVYKMCQVPVSPTHPCHIFRIRAQQFHVAFPSVTHHAYRLCMYCRHPVSKIIHHNHKIKYFMPGKKMILISQYSRLIPTKLLFIFMLR